VGTKTVAFRGTTPIGH